MRGALLGFHYLFYFIVLPHSLPLLFTVDFWARVSLPEKEVIPHISLCHHAFPLALSPYSLLQTTYIYPSTTLNTRLETIARLCYSRLNSEPHFMALTAPTPPFDEFEPPPPHCSFRLHLYRSKLLPDFKNSITMRPLSFSRLYEIGHYI